jgi:hypothetical protein
MNISYAELLTLVELTDIMERTYPDVARDVTDRIYPRRLQLNSAQLSPRLLMPVAMNLTVMSRKHFMLAGHYDGVSAHAYMAMCALADASAPTFHLTSDLFVAALHTGLPDVNVADIPWPHPAFLICVPPGTWKLRHGRDGDGNDGHTDEVSFVIFHHVHGASTPLTHGAPCAPSADFDGRASVICVTRQGVLHAWSGRQITAEPELSAELSRDVITLNADNEYVVHTASKLELDESHLTCRRAVNLLLLMLARPELISPGKLVRDAKIKRGVRVRPEVWLPNLLGKDYAVRTSEAESNGDDAQGPVVKVGPRRGHWRYFDMDAGWSKPCTWVEPTFVLYRQAKTSYK